MFQQFTARLVTLSTIATLSLSPAVSAVTVYQIDDGESNAAVGLTPASCTATSPPIPRTNPPPVFGDLLWLNSFNTRAGGEFIDSIDVVWGARVTDPCTKTVLTDSGISNEPAKVFLYTDANGDGQLELLAEKDTIVRPPDPQRPDIFSRIVLDQRQQVSGTFYVAALFPNQKEGQFPAALDIPPAGTPPRAGKSWLAFSTPSGTSPSQYFAPSVNPLLNLPDKNIYTAGYWLLRANGSAAPLKSVPESTSLIGLVAIATLSAGTLLRRKPKS